jgi:hypothetical protein
MRRPTDHELAQAVEQVATASRVPGLRAGVFELDADGLAVVGWCERGDESGDLRLVPVTLPAPGPGEDLALVACEAIEAALGARQDEIARIGFACADQDIDAGWVVGYMYE